MKMDQKLISSILKRLESIRNDVFDEDTIKLLLIDIRDFNTDSNSVFREICHFIAHPTNREKGLCLNEVDKIFFQFKHGNFGTENHSVFNINKISIIEYRIIQSLIKNTPQKYLNIVPISSDDASKLLERSYKKSGGNRVLNTKSDTSKVEAIFKIVMGMVIPSGAFTQAQFIYEIVILVSTILKQYSRAEDYSNDLRRAQNGIMLCILSLLQGAKFKLYDGSYAKQS